MSLLFDALKRAQDSDDGVEQGHSQFIDLSEPEAVTPSAVGLAGPNPAQETGVLAAQAIFSATARQSRRLVLLIVGGLVILLVAGAGGFWYVQRGIAPLASQPPIAILPPAPTTIDPAASPKPPAGSKTSETASLASAGETSTETAPAPQNHSTIPANSVASASVPVAAEVNGTAVHGQPTPAVRRASAPNPVSQKTASLVPLIENPGSGEGAAPRKAQAQSHTPHQIPKPELPARGNAEAQPVVDNLAASHIRLSTSGDPLRDGYQALTEGRLDDAERSYQVVIAKRPQERDALLGLAVIAHRKLQTQRASDLYRQVLRQDPGNATATAALVNLSVQVDPVAAESRLKQLLDQKPTAPELYHALGNVLARQKRWGEAQQAFFQAYTLEPSNALYAYNLAVALDRLHKPAAALPYYEKSAQILKPGEVAIDRDTIQRRVQELRSSLPAQH